MYEVPCKGGCGKMVYFDRDLGYGICTWKSGMKPCEGGCGKLTLWGYRCEVCCKMLCVGGCGQMTSHGYKCDDCYKKPCIQCNESISYRFSRSHLCERCEEGLPPLTPFEKWKKNTFYLNVPYNQKNDAKLLDASWDPRVKKWCSVEPGHNIIELIERWGSEDDKKEMKRLIELSKPNDIK